MLKFLWQCRCIRKKRKDQAFIYHVQKPHLHGDFCKTWIWERSYKWKYQDFREVICVEISVMTSALISWDTSYTVEKWKDFSWYVTTMFQCISPDVNRAKYLSRNWQKSLESNQNVSAPQDNRWILNDANWICNGWPAILYLTS